ncbi:hypothetical protein GW777_05875 [Candidatus Peregrinibacteria bacterium]|nr:hypothetical protein [bacterium]NCQ55814.1 hypothetical protein [Candidatus Parcubacteria bacterium]NCS67881.1 hypothetical protein [Candidatus Peregrinibacteria bacterium]
MEGLKSSVSGAMKVLSATVLLNPEIALAQENTPNRSMPVFEIFACDRTGTAYLERKSDGSTVIRTIRHVIERTLEAEETRCTVLRIIENQEGQYTSLMPINLVNRPITCEDEYVGDASCEIALMDSEVERIVTELNNKIFVRNAVLSEQSIGEIFAFPTAVTGNWSIVRLADFDEGIALFEVLQGYACEGSSGGPMLDAELLENNRVRYGRNSYGEIRSIAATQEVEFSDSTRSCGSVVSMQIAG